MTVPVSRCGAAVALVVSLAACTGSGHRSAQSDTSAGGGGRLSRSDAIGRVTRLTVEVLRADRTDAKLVSVAALPPEAGAGNESSLLSSGCAWVVSVNGDVAPAFGHGSHFATGTWILDSVSGNVTTMAADETTPAWFAGLPDHC